MLTRAGEPWETAPGARRRLVIFARSQRQLSWQRDLIRHGDHTNWIDSGRMPPAHRQWSA